MTGRNPLRNAIPATMLMLAVFAQAASAPEKAGDLFQNTKVWTVHLKFTAAQWEAMEPKGGPPGGGFGGRGGPGGPGGFGPGMMVAPVFMKADVNHDGKVSEEEFRALGEQWFTAWDKEKTG